MNRTPSKLSQIIYEEASSFLYPPPNPKQQLHALRQQLTLLPQSFETFKQHMIESTHDWINKLTALAHRQSKEKTALHLQLQKSKQMQQKMRSEVIQLKEMINQAMIGYSKELQAKNNEIEKLKRQCENHSEPSESRTTYDDDKNQIDLEIIQEESQHATFSSATTTRESKDDEKLAFVDERDGCQIDERDGCQNESLLNQAAATQKLEESQILVQDPVNQQDLCKNEHKRTKSFIDNFRKTIQQSFMERRDNSKSPTYYNWSSQKENAAEGVVYTQGFKLQPMGVCNQPLREISRQSHQMQNRTSMNVIKEVDSLYLRPKIIFTIEQPKRTSSFSSSSNLTQGEDIHKQEATKNYQTPKNQSFLKKKEHHRIFTEPSPDNIRCPQNYFSSKPHQDTYLKTSIERTASFQEAKSFKMSASKEKIKVTSRMIQDFTQAKRNPNSNHPKAAVYLGGKSVFRKFLLQLKSAFKKYVIYVGQPHQEVKYEGEKRNKMRWGRGRLSYRTGMVYEGEFRQNMRHGRGFLFMNGVSVYEGQWSTDRLRGEGYLKSMKSMTEDCPLPFTESSFCGNLWDNRLDGIGTIFLNKRQKIVTKFNEGVPVGELTYYNLHGVEFGVWPSQ